MDWELSKENFQPLKQGRDPTNLDEDAKSPAATKVQMEHQRRQAQMAIRHFYFRARSNSEAHFIRIVSYTKTTEAELDTI